MPNIVKNLCFLLFFCSFAWGVFYVSNSQSFLHFTEKVFLGEIGEKVSTIVGNFSIELEGDDDEEILGLKATPQSADWTAPICTATYTPSSWTSGSVQVTLMCSEPVEFCTMSDYSDCPQPQSFQPEPGMPCWRAQDITYNGYTIMACNLGATEVGTGVASYGYYYQRGNNYPMGDGTVTTYTPNNSTAVNASAYWPSNPYSSDTFIKKNSWDSSNNKNLRGGTGDTTSANGAGTREDRQGPCPSGYHVPSVYERNELLYGIPSSATGVAFLTNTLFLPLAGWRNYSTPSLKNIGTNGYYSASSPSSNQAYSLKFTTSTISKSASNYRGYGMPVRCFKNSYTSPFTPCESAPDIQYNGFTIKACNLGATYVWSGSHPNPVTMYGNYYQQGNNYPMGDASVQLYLLTWTSKVDASAFWPNNPYSNATFIKQNYWDSSNNKNLRWGTGDTIAVNGPGAREDRQGPCPAWYHVPSALEWYRFLWWISPSPDGIKFLGDTLLIPTAGYRYYTSASLYTSTESHYQSSTYAQGMVLNSQRIASDNAVDVKSQNPWYGSLVRCFLNSYEPPIAMSCGEAPDIQYKGFTVMACNLWATEVANGANPASYGYYYQRGNNYPMGDASIATYSPTSSARVDASAFWPNNPYSSATYIKQNNWDSSNNQNLRWGSGDTLTGNGLWTREDRQGPCPSGYHVPSVRERRQLTVGESDVTFRNILFLPRAGYRDSYANLGTPTSAAFWLSSPNVTDSNYSCSTSSYQYWTCNVSRGNALQIRCFKNSYDFIPCEWASDITYNGVTIMACNLGATEIYNGVNNPASYWYYYQWGNNYPMWDWSVVSYTPASSTAVDASAFGPNNPYSSATFIKQNNWDSSNNKNLRGGTGDTTTANGTGTREDRQGPCPSGYHVPSVKEWRQLVSGVTENIAIEVLHLPKAGFRYATSSSFDGLHTWRYYWTSSRSSSCHHGALSSSSTYNCGYAMPIRCFKNS